MESEWDTFPSKRVFEIGVLVWLMRLMFFLCLDIDISYRYFFSMLVILIGLLIVFYSNRNDLEQLNIKEEKIELVYLTTCFSMAPAK